MHRLVYLSEAVGDIGPKEVAKIVEASRRNNARLGVTGLLLYHDGRFFQEIEGDRSAVTQAFERIKSDPRHTGIEVLEFGRAKARAFEGWSLGWDHPEKLPERAQQAAFSIFDLITPDSALRGARPKVRMRIRDFLSGFQWLRKSSQDSPWF